MAHVLMVNPKSLLLALSLVALISVSLQGCTQHVIFQQEKGFSRGDNCLYCHSSSGERGAMDFTPIYKNPASHHPIGVAYPLGPASRPDFNQPDGYDEDTIFFDNDGTGKLNVDDIRLFGTGNDVTVECASCHREHGDPAKTRSVTGGFYLRMSNEGSRMCKVCHNR